MSWSQPGRLGQWSDYPSKLHAHQAYDAEVLSAVGDGLFTAVIWARKPEPVFFGFALDEARVVLVENESAFSVRTGGLASGGAFIKCKKSTPLADWIQASHPFYESDDLTHYLLPGETVIHIVSPAKPQIGEATDHQSAVAWAGAIEARS